MRDSCSYLDVRQTLRQSVATLKNGSEGPMISRRKFLEWTGTLLPFLGAGRAEALGGDDSRAKPESSVVSKTGSDVGTLFPFIYSQAKKTDFPLSFLSDQFKEVSVWKPQARGKLLE